MHNIQLHKRLILYQKGDEFMERAEILYRKALILKEMKIKKQGNHFGSSVKQFIPTFSKKVDHI